MQRQVPASQLKVKCLALLDEVHRNRREIVITKRGKPIAKLVPIDEQPKSFFGSMRSTMEINGDIISPIDEVWEAEHEDFVL